LCKNERLYSWPPGIVEIKGNRPLRRMAWNAICLCVLAARPANIQAAPAGKTQHKGDAQSLDGFT
jgi:hypothetical protein